MILQWRIYCGTLSCLSWRQLLSAADDDKPPALIKSRWTDPAPQSGCGKITQACLLTSTKAHTHTWAVLSFLSSSPHKWSEKNVETQRRGSGAQLKKEIQNRTPPSLNVILSYLQRKPGMVVGLGSSEQQFGWCPACWWFNDRATWGAWSCRPSAQLPTSFHIFPLLLCQPPTPQQTDSHWAVTFMWNYCYCFSLWSTNKRAVHSKSFCLKRQSFKFTLCSWTEAAQGICELSNCLGPLHQLGVVWELDSPQEHLASIITNSGDSSPV